MAHSFKKGLFVLFSATFLSKAIGFFRELVIASKFGLSEEFDILLTVFAVPATIVSLFLYAVPHILIPRLNLNEKSNAKFYKSFSEEYFWTYILFLILIVVLYLLSSFIYFETISIEGFEDHTRLLYKLFILFGIYILFNSVYSIFKALYNAKQNFVLPAFSPLLLHISIIFSVSFFYEQGVVTFAYGLTIGSFIQILVYIFDFKRRNIIRFFKFSIKPNKLDYSAYFIIFFIELLGQSYMLIDRSFIEKLPKGHISAIHYAGILNNLPITIIGMSLGTLLFPKITILIQLKKFKKLKTYLVKGSISSLSIGVIVFGIFSMFGESIISILFERGKFGLNAVQTTNSYLILMSIGLPFILLHIILAKLCFALKKEKVLLFSTIIALIFKFLFSLYFIDRDFYQGLALSTSFAFILNIMIISLYLYKQFFLKRRKI